MAVLVTRSFLRSGRSGFLSVSEFVVVEFVAGGSASFGGEGVVSAAAAGAAAGWGASEPGLFVFGTAGEPTGMFQAFEHRVEGSFVDSGALMDFEAVELAGVVDEITQDGKDWAADPQAVDVDVVKRSRFRGFPGREGLALGFDEDLPAGLGAELVVAQAGGHQLVDAILCEVAEQGVAARGGALRVAVGGAVVERCADVVFEPLELDGQGALAHAQVGRGGREVREGHGDLEAVQAQPAVQGAFDGGANVARDVLVEPCDHLREAGNTGRAGGDAQPVQGVVDDHLVGAEFGGDVGDRT